MALDIDAVRRIARLARIRVPEDDLPVMAEELSRIMEWIEQLNAVDTSNVEPMTSVAGMRLPQRPDAVTDGDLTYLRLDECAAQDVVIDFARRRQLPFEIALDVQGEVAQAFNRTEVTPTKFLLDPQGNIVRTYVGFTDFPDLQRRVDALLAT